ncbi:MAG: hypothetical protein GX348_06065 [Veillonellaceae bacterium]|nr:hypothetical protein [Veillonellaceae bacterium]
MTSFMQKSKNFFARSILKDTFNRDILTLLIVSIVIGSLLASALSMSANAYFSSTLNSLVGDYGEYDLVLQVREGMRDDASAQIQKIIDDVFPGSRMQIGPTVTGKTNIFVALPSEYKSKKVYEELDKTFGGIPGGASVGVMTEPRLNIRGVPDGAKNMLIDKIMEIDDVSFAFRDGGSIGVVLTSVEKTAAVNKEVEELLKQYQLIEISFPVGSEPSNPIKMGETIANDMKMQLNIGYAENVSTDGTNSDMNYLVSTMMELKRFLSAYASQVLITPTGGANLMKGDTVVFQGTAAAAPAAGNPVDKGNVVVQVTALRPDGSAEGVITQGDASLLTNNQGFKIEKNVVSTLVGTASYRNPRQELSGALNETTKLVGQIPDFAKDTQNVSQIALNALDNYDKSVSAIEQTISSIQAASGTIQAATSGLAQIDTSSMQNQITHSSRAIGNLKNTMQIVRLVGGGNTATIDELTGTQASLDTLNSNLAALNNVAANARTANAAIDSIVANGSGTVAALKSFDAAGARSGLTDAAAKINQIQQLDVPLITTQLQYMAAAAPNLKDEEISHSVQIMDQFIAGQVIPGARIQILTTRNVTSDAVAPIVYEQAGHQNIALYSADLGVIEPNARGEIIQILNEVQAVLAGLAAIIATLLFLALDHTAIMTVIRRRRLANRVKVTGWRGLLARITITFTAPERQYGMVIGAVMLTAIFAISGGGIPYLPWLAVPLLGALIGLIVANYTEKISPISTDEVTAGEALGLSFDEVMREIVVPSARPGLLQKLNRRKLKFR